MTAAHALGLEWPPRTRRGPGATPLLGEIGFAEAGNAASSGEVVVGCQALDPEIPWSLRWQTRQPVLRGTAHGVDFACTEALLFGAITLNEATFATTTAASRLEQASRQAYRSLFRTLDEHGYRHLVRVWNYLPRINEEERGIERYRQFNVGRHDAFADAGRPAVGAVPAACALGVPDGPLTVAFLASRTAALAIENPRQISAYDYPPDYGPRSPTFARAALLHANGTPALFISGTASIVEHRSLHRGDVVAQTHETLDNIDALLAECARVAPPARFGRGDLACVAYVRERRDLDAVRAVVSDRLGSHAACAYLQADICRADLLVEIEACAGLPNLDR